jgi:putative Holliday junction resolvase
MDEKRKSFRAVGIDFGMARIGVAISDEKKIIASPLTTLATESKAEWTVIKLVQLLKKHEEDLQYRIDEIVVGMPLLMSGRKGFLADEVTHFVELLQKQFSAIPIIAWDERLTSVQAERSLREGTMTRKKRSKFVDSVAAVIILQSYLDHKKARHLTK